MHMDECIGAFVKPGKVEFCIFCCNRCVEIVIQQDAHQRATIAEHGAHIIVLLPLFTLSSLYCHIVFCHDVYVYTNGTLKLGSVDIENVQFRDACRERLL
eukprot:GHVS01035239.1.p1 GENE.GHVS01035239.1~~GHVS01035239.1.p1  ORF type:complete len:100 (-),score=0.77 GHVS01035239.1:123-422(-)